MATTKFTVKRSSTGGDPAILGGGELAYSSLPADSSNGGDRLYIGTGVENDSGNAASHTIIGGKYYTDMLGGAGDIRGTLTTNSALIADSNSEIDQIKVSGSADIGNITIDSSAITTSVTDADLKLSPNGSGNISVTSSIIPTTDGTIDLGTPDNKFGTLYLAGATLVLGDLSLSDSGGSLSVKTTEGGTPATVDLSGSTTDDLAEGSTNLYYTEDRFNASISTKSTDDIAEGSNLFFTVERLDNRFDEKLALASTDDISEGSTNLYYTTARHDSDALVFIDSAYVQARQTTVADLDSSAVRSLVDSSYIQLRRPAESVFSVSGDGSNYSFTGDGFPSSATDPTLYLTRGKTYRFEDISGSHPLEIRSSSGGSAYSSGVTNNGGSGTVIFTVPMDAPSSLVYQCTVHSGMVGDIIILDNTAGTGVDSAAVTSLINASYIQSNQITYNNNDFADSAFVTTQINNLIDGAPGTLNTLNEIAAALNDDDSAYATLVNLIGTKTDYDSTNTIGLVDSAYVQARQLNFSDLLDSAEVIQLVDSAYVQSRQTAQDFAYSSLTGVPDLFDSNDATILIDSAYVQARQSSVTGIDSAATIALIDSAYVQARQTTTSSGIDSAATLALINASYIQSNQITYNNNDFADSAFVTSRPVSTFTNDVRYLDSTTVQAVINSSYVQARQDFAYASLTGAPNVLDSADVVSLVTANSTDSAVVISIVDSAYVRARQITYNNNNFADSAFVTTQINNLIDGAPGTLDTLNEIAAALNDDDSAYGTLVGLINAKTDYDSTNTIGLVDSAYVQLRQDYSYSSLTGKPDFVDSSDVQNIVDSAYVRTLLDSGFSVTGNITVGGELTVGTLNFTGAGSTTWSSDNELIFTATDRVLIDSAPFRVATMTTADISSITLPENGDMLYNATTNKFQGYENGAWINLALDSSGVTNIIDSAYVQARQTASGVDSAATIALIDSAYIELRRPPEAVFSVVNNGASDYTFSGDGFPTSENDPTIYLTRGLTYKFNVSASGHPFWIKTAANTGTGDQYNDGVTNNGTQSGTILFTVPFDAPTTLYYICQYHSGMVGTIKIIDETSYLDSSEANSLIDAAFTAKSTDNLSEGSSNLYYTTARADSDAKNAISGGTGVTVTNGEIAIGQAVGTTDSVTFSGLTVSGDLVVTGTTTETNTIVYTVQDPLIHLADSNETSDVLDIGFIGHYYRDGQRRHTGFFRDASDQQYYLYNNLVDSAFDSSAPPNVVDRNGTGFQLASLNVSTLSGHYLGFDSDFSAKSTTNLSEGSNLYYTTARHDSDTLAQVNNTYVRARQDYAYSSLTGIPDLFDSSDATLLVDSAYVQLRQDYAYSSLTGAPNVLDSADVTSLVVSLSTDSAAVFAIVDSAYVQLRQDYAYSSLTGAPTTVSSFTNDANYLDSTTATNLIDSAYITARSPSINVIDDIGNVDTSGKSSGSILVYNGTNWVIDQNLFGVEADGGDAFFIDEGIADDGGSATSTYTTSDRVDGGTAYAA